MKKEILIAILCTSLMLVTPFATIAQENKVSNNLTDKPDIEGLVAQIRVVIDEILDKYGQIPEVAYVCCVIQFIILYLFVRLAFCIFLFILAVPVLFLYFIMLITGEIELLELLINLHVSFMYLIDLCNPLYFPHKFFFSLSDIKDINNFVNDCPCRQE